MERIYTHMDKSDWGDGPWQEEPDKLQWIDLSTGLDCLIVRNHHGSLCGYVGLPPGHPLHGSDYQDVAVDVHGGGLTFADRCMEGLPECEGVCHIPEPGRPADVWWLGFDCGHAFDYNPAMEARLLRLEAGNREMQETRQRLETYERLLAGTPFEKHYRPLDYVRAEVTRLASQVAPRLLVA